MRQLQERMVVSFVTREDSHTAYKHAHSAAAGIMSELLVTWYASSCI